MIENHLHIIIRNQSAVLLMHTGLKELAKLISNDFAIPLSDVEVRIDPVIAEK